jgi:ketosteroid isomerase-like protein
MSQENVDIVGAYFASQGEGDRALRFLDPRVEWHVRPDFPDPGVYRGHNGFRTLESRFAEVLDEEHYQPLEFIDAGTKGVVVPLQWTGRGRLSGAGFLERSEAWVFTVEGGLITTVFEFAGKAEALEAVGLSE